MQHFKKTRKKTYERSFLSDTKIPKENTVKTPIDHLKRILRHRELYTPMELVRLGVIGSRSMVRKLYHDGKLDGMWTSQRRLVIFRDSLIEYLKELER